MALTMHAASAPVFVRMLGNLLTWLDKAEAHAAERRFDADQFVGLRLAPDMFAFGRQIQVATDMAKGCMARLAGVEVPKWDDNETTLAALRARVQRTLDFVQGFAPAQIDGSEQREIVLVMRQGDPLHFKGQDYLLQWVMPNFYFHVTTAYALLRHGGVALGKRDYLGSA